MSNKYELMYILRPDLSEDQVGDAVTKYQDYLSETGAENLEVKVKGKRRLAYPVGKYLDGIYVQMNYEADGSQNAPLERMMRLSEDAIRYLTIKLKKRAIIAQENAAAEPITEPADD
ncbi:MAG: 30S ribosomal protein S6 [Pleurocapsa sp. SU_5_0]|nr:30S ribosomal protein S6 [Pleurocapsa sp. SU_5_0]NJO96644.1 30S ribosomal protein S6 [Pleurocapsa sp. CRU_1_2]NJR44459.1 30S ribosomal protein S6 [Hyellaceae cyanobacterium CSU_1_1]